VDRPPPLSRDAFFNERLSSLSAFWLGIRCAPPCTRVVYCPLKLMSARHGNARLLSDVLKRLRCEYCRAAPGKVSITDHPNDGNEGGQRSSWNVELVP
jgi:hypothetical protein